MFGHAHVTTPTYRKYRTFAPPLKFPSYATEQVENMSKANSCKENFILPTGAIFAVD